MLNIQTRLFATMTALTVALCGSVIAQDTAKHADHPEHEMKAVTNAVAVLMPTEGNKVSGTLMMKQMDGYVMVSGTVTGLTPGEHGFHIHEFGDLTSPDGKSAGGHFNPTNEKHGAPEDKMRHAGDLGNITADKDGTAKVSKKAQGLKLASALGRGVVVHGGVDDLKSQPSGDAGPRVAVGVIGVAESKMTK